MKTSNPKGSLRRSDDWRCACCGKLLGAIEAGRLHIRFARGHQYIVGVPASVICRGCGTLNEQGTCVGGANPGARCGDGIAVCAGGTCDPGTGSETTGSHNLVVGSWIAHSSYAGLGVGRSHVLNAPQCAAVGAGNTCGAAKAFLAGRTNNASGESCSVLGGTGGTCSGTESVVVGGLENEASVDQGIVP